MKKQLLFIFTIIFLIAIVSTSCKKANTCHCYNRFTGKKDEIGSSLTTKEECVGYKDRCRCGTECKWE